MATSPAELSKSFKCSQEEFMHSHYRQVQGEYVLHECQSKHETSQRDIIEELKGKRGVKRIKQFVICNAFVVDFDDDSVLEFLAEVILLLIVSIHPSLPLIPTKPSPLIFQTLCKPPFKIHHSSMPTKEMLESRKWSGTFD